MEFWWVRERVDGHTWKLLKEFTSRQAADDFRTAKIAEDPAHADVLFIVQAGGSATKLLRCSECKREPGAENPGAEWRVYSNTTGGLVAFCPECAEREFGDS